MTSKAPSSDTSIAAPHRGIQDQTRTIAIIQARMGSTRLPGKVLHQICGRSVLDHVVSRVGVARRLDGVMVATTRAAADDSVVEECNRLNVPCFRGSEEDVLDRYYQAAKANDVDVVVRITADCPIFDGTILDEMLDVFASANRSGDGIDFLSNVQRRTFPQGLDAEIFSLRALASAHREAIQPYEREHVTPYLYEHPRQFRLRSFEGAENLSHHRWTLDTIEDLEFIKEVYLALYRVGRLFETREVLALVESRPELMALNAHVRQKKRDDS